MRFLVDEGVDTRLAAMLTAAGHDVVEIVVTARGSDDLAIADRAMTERRIIVTADKDFGDLAFRDGIAMPGIVLMRMPGSTFEERSSQLSLAISLYADRLDQMIIVVEPDNIRARPLLRVV